MALRDKITESRKLLQNPYAYLDEEGGFSAAPKQNFDRKAPLEEEIRASRLLLQNRYAYLEGTGRYDAIPKTDIQKDEPMFRLHLNQIRSPELIGRKISSRNIEKVARRLQREMWTNRRSIWDDGAPVDPLTILEPSVAFDLLGYDFELCGSLGQISSSDGLIEVAGVIDRAHRRVQVSRQFSPEIRRFTAAHELGHAMLHQGTGLHRDRALDGAPVPCDREAVELEADKFAVYFLMPERLVRAQFRRCFATDCFAINSESAFSLNRESAAELSRKCRSLRDLSRRLAGAEHYGQKFFNSLAKQFGVSKEAMAIRLEELELVKY